MAREGISSFLVLTPLAVHHITMHAPQLCFDATDQLDKMTPHMLLQQEYRVWMA
jgi:hypothetical protein